jgi:spermidine synthase
MKVPKFRKTTRENDVIINLSTDDGSGPGVVFTENGDEFYLDFSQPLKEKQILKALADAYKCGYETGVKDSQEAVRRVIYERKTDYFPKAKIATITDYTKD